MTCWVDRCAANQHVIILYLSQHRSNLLADLVLILTRVGLEAIQDNGLLVAGLRSTDISRQSTVVPL